MFFYLALLLDARLQPNAEQEYNKKKERTELILSSVPLLQQHKQKQKTRETELITTIINKNICTHKKKERKKNAQK
jgi:hypothetical protein